MSEERPHETTTLEGHAVDDEVAHQEGGATHVDAHTALSDENHGHAEPRVGPVDWPTWGFAALGVAAGLIVVALFYVAAS